jgi:hypothetical protein
MFSDEGWLKELPVPEDRLEGNNTIPPGIEMRKGGKGIDSSAFYAGKNRGGESWLYIWGAVHYDDGFGNERTTKFCFRYNMAGASRDVANEGFPKENARYHVYGNDAD